MKKFICGSVLLILLLLGIWSIASAGGLAVYNGVVVPSVESYMDRIPACNSAYQEKDYYIYRYDGYGEEYDGVGNNATWALFEQYVKHLDSTEFFEIIAHKEAEEWRNTWYLKYTGPEKVRQFQLEIFDDERCAIAVRSFDGDVIIFYSYDIATSDLEETMERFGLSAPSVKKPAVKPTAKPTAKPTPKPTAKPSRISCEVCDGDGKCNNCGGDMWFEGYKWVWNSRRREYDNEYVRELCHEDNCFAGSCKVCDGDGWID